MKMPASYEGPLGYSDSGFDHLELGRTILSWRGGRENGKLCLFNRLAAGENVSAKRVAAHARSVAATIHETSCFASEKAKLEGVATYAERMALIESCQASLTKACATAKSAGLRYRDVYEDFLCIAAEEFRDE